jgi:4,5-dihydroxyphthalate decarboxylase
VVNTNTVPTLYTLFGNHAGTAALKTGRVSSPRVSFEFADVKVVNTQFKALIREQKYDLAELAINTFLQGYEYGKPYVLLPVTIMGRNQHHTIFFNADRGHLTPRDLNGARIGVRAYTQTTGVWVRGFLADDYGVDLGRVTWVTFEDPHVAEYRDPAHVQRAPEGKALKQMLLDGEIDAAILGDVAAEGPVQHLIPDHEAEGRRWAQAHGGVPINHMAVIRQSIAREQPEVVREVYQLLKESRALATGQDPRSKIQEPSSKKVGAWNDPLRIGVAANRASLEMIIRYSFQQGLISRQPTVDELFDETTRLLGNAAD